MQQAPADHLVERVVAPDVLAHEHELAGGTEEAGGMEAARALEGRLAQAVGKPREQRTLDARAARQTRGIHGDLLQGALAADAARGGRVEAPRARVAEQGGR